MAARYRDLHGALLDVLAIMNRPQRDEAMIRAAGIHLDRALFPLLVRIARSGPIGVVELADRVGRDHTTVSRQVARLTELGLVERRLDPSDRRARAAVATPAGAAMAERVDVARARLLDDLFAGWDPVDVAQLVRLMQRFAEGLAADPEESVDET